MAIAAFHGIACKGQLAFRRPLIYCVHKACKCNSVAAVAYLVGPGNVQRKEALLRGKTNRTGNDSDYKSLEWKKLSSGELGIQTSMIASSTILVLNGLRRKGYEGCPVGGCVRDLILNSTPKDFDIMTLAELKEVSSFSTVDRKFGRNSCCAIRKRRKCDKVDFIRWKNCLKRDFKINGLMFDPFARVVYDYTGGLDDTRRAKVRNIIPACTSFPGDGARIL